MTRLPNLTTRFRAPGGTSWRRLSTDFKAHLELLKEYPDEFGIAAACALSPNGYVREAAVLNLAAMSDFRAFSMLMMRSADWVPTVAALDLADQAA